MSTRDVQYVSLSFIVAMTFSTANRLKNYKSCLTVDGLIAPEKYLLFGLNVLKNTYFLA